MDESLWLEGSEGVFFFFFCRTSERPEKSQCGGEQEGRRGRKKQALVFAEVRNK